MEFYIGQIFMGGWNFAPRGSAYCNGQLLAISQNTALFSLLGTTYGGDGRTTFGLPELRGRYAMHHGNGPALTPRPLGQKSGQEGVALNTLQMPNHTHTAVVKDGTLPIGGGKGTATDPTNNYLGDSGTSIYKTAAGAGSLGGLNATVTNGNTGGSQSHNNMSPYQTVSFCIALVGIFPSRN